MEITPETQAAFQAENQMTIEEAWAHVQQWFAEGKYDQVAAGCQEIIKFVPDFPEVKEMLAKAQSASTPVESQPSAAVQAEEKQAELAETQAQSVAQTLISAEQTVKAIEKGKFDWKADKVFAAFGYVGPFFFVPLLFRPKSELCKLHGKQALVLTAFFWAFVWVAKMMFFLAFFAGIVQAINFFLTIFMMWQAWNERMYTLPGLEAITKKF